MKLRIILLILSLLTFLSASIGGYTYYSSLTKSTFLEAERRAVAHAEMIKKNLSSFLSENISPVKTLSGMKEFQALLIRPSADSLANANAMLDHFKTTLDVDVCYLMDSFGTTIASSNRNDSDSFVGRNFSFRPYFQEAIQGTPSTYMALGTASLKRGVYYSHPVYQGGRGAPIGIVVIKASIDLIERELEPTSDETVLVTDPQGIVFISSRQDWLFRGLWKLSQDEKRKIADIQQFGKGPWKWTGLEINGNKNAVDKEGNEYLMNKLDLYNYPGWSLIHLYNLEAVSKIVSDPLIKVTGSIVLSLCMLVGLSVFLLYRKASEEIVKRKVFENALIKSEERYRSIYHNTPAMLHSIDTSGRLVSVSDHWIEVLGYDREEVIGQELTQYFTPASRRLAEGTVFPEFFEKGFCKDIPYQFIKKNGDIIDVLLSAIGDRDDEGNIIRSLAVSIDVTERNRAEKALTLAKEELDRYSKDLENQVADRTKKITSILHQLRQLSGSIMTNQEKERSAIARELHDELGQVLTALRMDSVWLLDRLKKSDTEASQRALTMCELIDNTIEEVRGMAIRLRPGVLDDLGLVDALEWYTSDFEKRTGITCVFEHFDVPGIDDTLATAAYRITQEALTNVARHAFASRVEVTLRKVDSELSLAAVDDGRGFSTVDLNEAEALGLVGMRERAGLVGGVLDVESQPGAGTRVLFRVPTGEKAKVAQ
ncbi:MAG: PAS domain S-box protein [Desulfobacterales bacterium]|nr:MAG: PAS domain S-box protein [Desulfobacterales bacterium]